MYFSSTATWPVTLTVLSIKVFSSEMQSTCPITSCALHVCHTNWIASGNIHLFPCVHCLHVSIFVLATRLSTGPVRPLFCHAINFLNFINYLLWVSSIKELRLCRLADSFSFMLYVLRSHFRVLSAYNWRIMLMFLVRKEFLAMEWPSWCLFRSLKIHIGSCKSYDDKESLFYSDHSAHTY